MKSYEFRIMNLKLGVQPLVSYIYINSNVKL